MHQTPVYSNKQLALQPAQPAHDVHIEGEKSEQKAIQRCARLVSSAHQIVCIKLQPSLHKQLLLLQENSGPTGTIHSAAAGRLGDAALMTSGKIEDGLLH